MAKKDIPLDERQRALAEESLPLVRWTIQQYIACNEGVVGLGFEDLCQEGAVALCRAAVSYREGGVSFKTYAITVIRNYLIDYCRGVAKSVSEQMPISNELSDDTSAPQADLPDSASNFEEEHIGRLWTLELLEKRKAVYSGVAKQGVEALELKILKDYGPTDIAQLYHTEPKLVGAWISKAKKRIQQDLSREELRELDIERAS